MHLCSKFKWMHKMNKYIVKVYSSCVIFCDTEIFKHNQINIIVTYELQALNILYKYNSDFIDIRFGRKFVPVDKNTTAFGSNYGTKFKSIYAHKNAHTPYAVGVKSECAYRYIHTVCRKMPKCKCESKYLKVRQYTRKHKC